MNTRFIVFASYNILQYLCDFIHVLIFVTVSKCRKSHKLTNIVFQDIYIYMVLFCLSWQCVACDPVSKFCVWLPIQEKQAFWEPFHGKFRMRHPWEDYVKVGKKLRKLTHILLAMDEYINSTVQVSSISLSWVSEIMHSVNLRKYYVNEY